MANTVFGGKDDLPILTTISGFLPDETRLGPLIELLKKD